MEAKFTAEAVTPVFIAGADQRNIENEGLRAPSIRGLLRWWFRAIMGGMTSLENLKELEKSVFGSTEQKSAVKIRTATNSQPASIDVPSELGYLWFSMHMQKKKDERLCCYPKGSKFEIMLYSGNEATLNIASGCLWALLYLGGVGSRMRRGAGSLKVINSSDKAHLNFLFKHDTVTGFKKSIEENLEKIFKDFKKHAGDKYSTQNFPNFPVLSKKHAKISLVQKMFDTPEKALAEVSNIYQNFRRSKRLEYRYTFGLPIITYHEFRDLRHSSPLLIGVANLSEGYTVRLVKFYTSIHHEYSSNLRFLRGDLDGFDAGIGELTVDIPEFI